MVELIEQKNPILIDPYGLNITTIGMTSMICCYKSSLGSE